jgi:low affinity Fe/Cu permease
MTASIFSSVTSPFWGWIWFLVEAICIIAVAIGCGGEVWTDFRKFSDKVKQNPKSARLEEKRLAGEIKEWWNANALPR